MKGLFVHTDKEESCISRSGLSICTAWKYGNKGSWHHTNRPILQNLFPIGLFVASFSHHVFLIDFIGLSRPETRVIVTIISPQH